MNSRVARWLYYTAQERRGEPVRRVVGELDQSQHWPLERLQSLNFERSAALVRHAFETVPYYRMRWSAIGLTPGDVSDPENWDRIPALERSELQDHGNLLHSFLAPAGLKASTSGSSGMPVAVHRSHLSWAHAHANVIRGWRWHGIDVGDRYAYFWGLALDRNGRLQAGARDWFFNRVRCSAFELDPERARAFYQHLRSHRAEWAFGYPSALTQFAREINALDLDGRALGWKAVVTTAEVLRADRRDTLADTFGCAVVDSYGAAEIGVAGFQCEAGGMHVPIESTVVDLVPKGEDRFEVLLTDLHNFSQPVIRYRIGDLVGPAPTSCACGRALPLLGAIEGRAGDFVTLADGRQVNGLLPYYIFRPYAKSGTVDEYQFAQFPDGKIELRIAPGPHWDAALEPEIRAKVGKHLGVTPTLKLVERFERSGRGKHRDFVRIEGDEEKTA